MARAGFGAGRASRRILSIPDCASRFGCRPARYTRESSADKRGHALRPRWLTANRGAMLALSRITCSAYRVRCVQCLRLPLTALSAFSSHVTDDRCRTLPDVERNVRRVHGRIRLRRPRDQDGRERCNFAVGEMVVR